MRVTSIAVVGGDGIGPEVVAEGLKVLGAVLDGVELVQYDLGAARYHRTGEVLPDSVRDELAQHEAILLGAVGDPSVAPGVLERGLLLKLRFDFDQYVNLRPSRLWPGTSGPLAHVKPGEIDFIVVREGTEGLYTGAGGSMHRGTAAEIATEESLNTRYGVERVIRDAFSRARKREARKVTMVHKTNVPLGADVRRGRRRVQRRRHRIPARRRGGHVHGHQSPALRRDRDGQSLW
jgi:3-isopropylmalate dehydrogenase